MGAQIQGRHEACPYGLSGLNANSNTGNQLPTGWVEAKIGELIGPAGVFIDGDWVETKDQDPNGDVRLIQLADVGDGTYRDRSSRFLTRAKADELDCTFLKAGDVLIARMPDPLGRACIFPGDSKDSVTVVDVCIVRTGALGANHRWLVWAVNSPQFRNEIAALQSGSTRKRISRGNLSTLFMPIPPLAEQARIARETEKQITRLEAGVVALKRVQANLKRYRAAVLKAAVEGRLVPTEAELARREGRPYEPASELLKRILAKRRARWEADHVAKLRAAGGETRDGRWKAKYEEPAAADTHDFPNLPPGWLWARAEQLCGFITKGTTPAASKLFSDLGEIPYIKVYNLTDRGNLDFTKNPTFVSKTTHVGELARSRVLPGDVLMNIVGPPLGKVSIVPDTYAEWNINQAIAFFRPVPGYDRKFLSFCLLSKPILDWAIRRAKATAGQFNLTLEICRDLPLPVPPEDEQHRTVVELERRLSVIDELEMQVEANLKRAERLRQAILKRAFEGKLVPQDPNDEPASMLLERIKDARREKT